MPISRRNTGRSPVPPWRPSTFLPPSHYAAAAAADPYSSDSSFEFKSHFNAPTSPVLPSAPTTPTAAPQARQSISQLGDIEAQLLPSLRDTIHRMTRPPSSLPTNPSSSTHLDIPTMPLGRSTSPSFSSTPSSAPPSQLLTPTQTLKPPPSRSVPTTPTQTQIPTRPLKSALRTPTSKTSRSRPSTPTSFPVPQSPNPAMDSPTISTKNPAISLRTVSSIASNSSPSQVSQDVSLSSNSKVRSSLLSTPFLRFELYFGFSTYWNLRRLLYSDPLLHYVQAFVNLFCL
jgi:hypothetical protein